jgi:predicted secreted protein
MLETARPPSAAEPGVPALTPTRSRPADRWTAPGRPGRPDRPEGADRPDRTRGSGRPDRFGRGGPARPAPAWRALAAALAGLLIGLGGAPTAAAQTLAAPENVVHLDAGASAEVAPDLLQISFSTRREGPEAGPVQAQLRQALDAALAEARRATRPGEVEVRTGNFSLQPRYVPKGGTSGWVGSAELVVEGRDSEAIAALAGRIQTMSVAGTGWSLSRAQREKTEAALAAEAIEQFRAKADRTARQFGFTGWLLREVTLGGDGPPPGLPRMRLAQSAAPAAMDAPLPVEAGRATVTVTVQGSVQLTR